MTNFVCKLFDFPEISQNKVVTLNSRVLSQPAGTYGVHVRDVLYVRSTVAAFRKNWNHWNHMIAILQLLGACTQALGYHAIGSHVVLACCNSILSAESSDPHKGINALTIDPEKSNHLLN